MEIDNGLLEKYRALLAENSALREENERLKARLGITDPSRPNPPRDPENHMPLADEAPDLPEKKPPPEPPTQLDPARKIHLFMSLFKRRGDIYAKRWQNREGRAGYAPVCRNEWKAGICRKPTVKCFDCSHPSYGPLDENVIEAHLRGTIVAGIYPLRGDVMSRWLSLQDRHPIFGRRTGHLWKKHCPSSTPQVSMWCSNRTFIRNLRSLIRKSSGMGASTS